MTRLLQISDSHERAVLRSFSACFDKRIFGFCTGNLIRRFQHDDSRLDAAVTRILKEKPDAVLFTGDAVSTADPLEFERALPHFLPLANSGIPLICTPGNHDLYVRRKTSFDAMHAFYDALTPLVPYDKPLLIRIGDIRIAALPESRPTLPWLSCGGLDGGTVDFLENEAQKDDPAPLVIAGHFPVLEHSWRRGLRNAERVKKLLRSKKIALSLCGHVHHPRETLAEDGTGEVICGSVTRSGIVRSIEYDKDTRIFRVENLLPEQTV